MGSLQIIWGGLLVPLTFPWAWGYIPQLGFIGSLDQMTFYILGIGFPYAVVVTFALAFVGLGLSNIAFDAEVARARARQQQRWAYESAIAAAKASGDDE